MKRIKDTETGAVANRGTRQRLFVKPCVIPKIFSLFTWNIPEISGVAEQLQFVYNKK